MARLSSGGSRKSGKTHGRANRVGVAKVKNGALHIAAPLEVSSKTPKTSSEMIAAEKRSRISQKKRLGQPAGKPRRVKSLKRRKK